MALTRTQFLTNLRLKMDNINDEYKTTHGLHFYRTVCLSMGCGWKAKEVSKNVGDFETVVCPKCGSDRIKDIKA